jgi:hypothetical protein
MLKTGAQGVSLTGRMKGGFLKFFLIYFVVAMGIGVVWVGSVKYFTTPLEMLGDTFFNLVNFKRYDDAYFLLSTELRNQIPQNQFPAYLERRGLLQVKTSKWFDSFESKNTGTVRGVVELESGKKTAVKLYAVKEAVKPNQKLGSFTKYLVSSQGELWVIYNIETIEPTSMSR